MTHRTRIIATLSGGALLALVASLSVATSGASFTASTVSPASHSASTASLEPLADVVAQRNTDGSVDVSWTPPVVRGDVAPVYRVERSLGGSTAVIDPDISTGSGFTDDPAVAAVLAGKKVTAIALTTQHTCALAEGSVYCWGSRGNGALGTGIGGGVNANPQRVGGALDGKSVTEISAGISHTCALAEGTVYCWGWNRYGQVGDGTTSDRGTPRAVGGVLAGGTVTSMSAGARHTCAVMDGWPYCWGEALALGTGAYMRDPVTQPVAVSAVTRTGSPGALAGKTVTSVSSGAEYSCVLTAEGAAVCWGDNGYGQGGSGSDGSSYPSPIRPAQGGAQLVLREVVAGPSHTCGITRDEGHLYCWGRGSSGEMGRGDQVSMITYPAPVLGALEGRSVTTAGVGHEHTCAVVDEELYCWGSQNWGSLGDGVNATTAATLPVRISGGTIGDAPVTMAVSDRYHGCAIADENAHCWGSDMYGALGLGSHTNLVYSYPVAVKTSGALAGAPTCLPGWLLGEDQKCRPAPETPLSYRIGYTKSGWSPPAPTEVDAVWGGSG